MLKHCTVRLLILLILLTGTRAFAQEHVFALGLRLSNSSPTLNNSVTGRYYMNDGKMIEGMIAFGSRFGVGGLLEKQIPFNIKGFSWFYGGGAYVGFQEKKTYAGPTGILGLNYSFVQVPINLSVDWKPELDIVPDIHFVPLAFGLLSVRFFLN